MPKPPWWNKRDDEWGDRDLLRWYERAKAADPALRRVVTRTATGPTPDFEALRPRLDTVFGGDDDAEC